MGAGEMLELLDLMQLGRAANPVFRRRALAWLGSGIEFDGWVWGSGRRLPDGSVVIDDARLEGRSPALLAEFGEVAALDPVSRRFALEPRRLQNVCVSRDYAAPRLRPVGDYLRRHRIGQLMLCGVTHPLQGRLSWLTLYRAAEDRPFDADEARFAEFALPFVLMAGEPCDASRERLSEQLTPREREVASAYAAGADYKRIARDMALAPATVRSHLLKIFRKLGVHSKIELRQRLVD
ncbi:MAG: helix-turn-helix transcriptional regulator [Rhodocyclaceae bacterium]|nr:helix-turn-helix transcriptional regulator [Rhodocyclaceae bacterium]